MKLFNRLNKATMTFVFLLPLTPMVSFGQDTLTDGTVYYSSSFLNLEGLSTNEKILLIVSLLEVNTYHMILANGLTMIVALVKDEVITYSRIYESMDRINIFDSQWEKDVSQKLTNIGEGLNALMYEIEASNRRIVNELSNLTYATEEGFRELNGSITSELQSIDSSIKFNNLLTGIQTYQMYKINKNTKLFVSESNC